MACLMGAFLICGLRVTPIHAFMGEFISTDGKDMALIAGFRRSDIDYESSDTDAGDIDRTIYSIGLSKSVTPKIKVFGSFNYTADGELGGNNADLDSGYSLTAGAGYTFWEQEKYSLEAYGELNYIIEEKFEHAQTDRDLTLDGYELIAGVMGSYHIHPRLDAYGALQYVTLSDLTMDVSSPTIDENWDIEREDRLGAKLGLIYDLSAWFVKAEVGMVSEQGIGVYCGLKF
jgi:predicted porin